MIYPIVMYGDPVLRQKAKDIAPGTDISTLVEDMFETMYAASGVGLAAPQIGKSMRLFVIDGSAIEDQPGMEDFKKVLVNPQMIEEWEYPGNMKKVASASLIFVKKFPKGRILIKYFDENWNAHEGTFDGLKARIIQHEYDHIEGKMFVDYLTPLKKRLLKGKLSDISKGKVDTEYRILAPLKK